MQAPRPDKLKTRSLTSQAVLVTLAAQVVCALTLCTAAVVHELHTRYRALDTQVQGRSDSLLGAIQDAEDPDSNVTIDPAELDLPPHDIYAVYNGDGRELGRSAAAPPQLIAPGRPGFRDVRSGRETYRVYQRDALRIIDRAEYGTAGLRRPVIIVYAVPEGRLRHEVFESVRFYVLTVLLVTAAAAIVLPLLLRRRLRPLSDLAAATATIEAPAFHFEPPPSALRVRELEQLTVVLAASVARVRDSFAREQQFVSDAAHELKTAVAVTRSSVQLLLLRRRTEEAYREGLAGVVSDVARLESLVGQMLLLAGRSEGSENTAAVSDLCERVRRVAALLQPVAEERGIPVEVAVPTTAAEVRLHPQDAETLLSNLLLNALQHSPPASGPVTISVKRMAENQVMLTVADHGEGIEAEALPHIFDRFYRGDISRSRRTGGTGLGLAIARAIVASAGGTIRAESKFGAGTAMVCVLPLV